MFRRVDVDVSGLMLEAATLPQVVIRALLYAVMPWQERGGMPSKVAMLTAGSCHYRCGLAAAAFAKTAGDFLRLGGVLVHPEPPINTVVISSIAYT
jgi:hypothetical protein